MMYFLKRIRIEKEIRKMLYKNKIIVTAHLDDKFDLAFDIQVLDDEENVIKDFVDLDFIQTQCIFARYCLGCN